MLNMTTRITTPRLFAGLAPLAALLLLGALGSAGASAPVALGRFHCQATRSASKPPAFDRGRAGAAAVSSPTPSCPAGEVPQPVGVRAPKGFPGRGPSFPSSSSGTLGPLRPTSPTSPALASYHYAAFQSGAVSGIGTYAYLQQSVPHLDLDDYHSLAEIAAESADGQQIVEVGWTVDRGVNGDTTPRIFVFHWVDGQGTCYNGCGYQQVSATTHPGDPVNTQAVPQQYEIDYFGGNWWVGVSGQWIGYFPGSLWTSYTTIGEAQWFGEVSLGSSPSCTDMGNGTLAPASGAATITGETMIAADNTTSPAPVSTYVSDPSLWGIDTATGRFGGPGACADTWINGGPSGLTNNGSPTFTFASEDPGAGFQCAIDSGAYAACSGPGAADRVSLPDGQHTFSVRAVTAGGTPDPSPASSLFTIDTTPPNTTVTAAPPALGRGNTLTYSFSSTEPGVFQCSIDGGAFTPCVSSQTYSGLADGVHQFYVQAIDDGGNADPTPAGATATLDNRPPAITTRAARSQKVHSRWGMAVRARCDETCTLTYTPRLVIKLRHRTRTIRLRAITKVLPAGTFVTFKVSPSHAVRKRVESALNAKGRVTFATTLVGTDAAGNSDGAAVQIAVRPASR